MGHYIEVTALPSVLRRALESVGFHRKDIEVEVKEEFEPRPSSAKGRRGFVVACRLDDSEEFQVTWGSFGGSNMFVKSIDDFSGASKIPDNIAFVKGLSDAGPGYPGFATIYISPRNANSTLLPPSADVTEREAKMLAIFKRLKSAYRKEYLVRMKATNEEVDNLVTRGFLSRNKAGATSITTAGRNAAGKDYY